MIRTKLWGKVWKSQINWYVQPQVRNQTQNVITTLPPTHQQYQIFAAMPKRGFTSRCVTKNIELISVNEQDSGERRPLSVILCWLGARRKDVMKFATIYLEQDFDVMTVHTRPWQFIRPTSGSRVVMSDVLKFLLEHEEYDRILLHGFSAGAYLWGETLDLMLAEPQKYEKLWKRIVGQVWDSAVDFQDVPTGLARAVFPHNKPLETLLRKYVECHLSVFYKQSTKYYVQSSKHFHTNVVRSPTLMFVSKADSLGTVACNTKVRDIWRALGTKPIYMKIFENSPHVNHFRVYPKEYVSALFAFLAELNLIRHKEKIQARL